MESMTSQNETVLLPREREALSEMQKEMWVSNARAPEAVGHEGDSNR